MKQLFFLASICFLFSCNNSSEDTTANLTDSPGAVAGNDSGKRTTANTGAAPVAINFPILTKDEAALMIFHFLTSRDVDHSRAMEIQRISFAGDMLRNLLEVHSAQKMTLYTAAYRDHTDPARRNKKTIIVELQMSSGAPVYYDIFALHEAGAAPICPPPTGTCDFPAAIKTLDDVKKYLN